LPTGGPETDGASDAGAAFAMLSAQIGELATEGRIAGRLEISDAELLGAGVATTAMSEEEIAATHDLASLMGEGLLSLPPDLEALVRDRQTMLSLPITQAQVDGLLSQMSDSEHAALASLAKSLGPLFAAMQQKGVADARSRLHALRDKGKMHVGRGVSLASIEPEELRELLEDLLRRDGRKSRQEQPEEEEPVSAPSEKPKWIEPELRSISELSDIVLPSLDFSALEASFAAARPSLLGLDVDDVAELLMMQCAASHEGEMGELIDRGRHLAARQNGLRASLEIEPSDLQKREALVASMAESDTIADKLEFFFARRECFSVLARAMLRA